MAPPDSPPSSPSSTTSSSPPSYQETSTLLGYASPLLTQDPLNQLGGQPTFFTPPPSPSSSLTTPPPSSSRTQTPSHLTRCRACHALMPLLLQLNGTHERFPNHDRRLFLFGCRAGGCRRKSGSVRAVRGVKVLEGTVATVGESTGVTERVAERRALGDELFGMAPGVKGGQLGMNPFSLSTNTATGSQEAQVNPFRTQTASTSTTKSRPESSETYADRARSAPKPSPTPKKSGPPTEDLPSVPAQPYPSSFIDAEYESWAPPQKTDQAQGLRTDYERIERDSDEPATGKEDAQLFESAMDSTFQKFADRLASNPEQVLRYELGGQPLLYSHDDDVGKLLSKGDRAGQAALPSCSRCGSSRVVEYQLMPHAIEILEKDESGLDGTEWGTIIVAVCGDDCVEDSARAGGSGYFEEWVGVQWEEIVKRR